MRPLLLIKYFHIMKCICGIALATACLVGSAIGLPCHGQNATAIAQHVEQLLSDEIHLTDSSVHATELQYMAIASQVESGQVDCATYNAIRTTLLMARIKNLSSSLIPSVIRSFESPACPIDCNAFLFLMGNVHFLEGDFNQAIDSYTKAKPGEGSEQELLHYVRCNLNAAAALQRSGSTPEAIDQLKLLLTFLENNNNSALLRDAGLQLTVQINLAAMHLSAYANEAALEILLQIKADQLDDYWTHIRNVNLLIAYQGLDSLEASSALWTHHFSNSSNLLQKTALSAHKHLIQQCLMSEDFDSYLLLRQEVESGVTTNLTKEDNPYANLLNAPIDSAVNSWKQYVRWEKQHFQFRMARNEGTYQCMSTELDNLETKLLDANNSLSKFKTGSWIMLLLLAIGGAFFKLRSMKVEADKRKKLAFAMHSAPTSEQLRAPSPIDLDDLRLLGDALVNGKQVSDAMLVLQKLRGMVHTPEFLPFHRMESIEGFRDMNETEKKILGYLIGGFDAKETARMLQVTPSHVYNMRSAIRIKLDIPREEKISHWLMQHYPDVFKQV